MSLTLTPDHPPLSREHLSSIPDMNRSHIDTTSVPISPSVYPSSPELDDNENDNCDNRSDTMISPRHTQSPALKGDQAPALPAKSSRRASRMLGMLPLKMAPAEQPAFTQTAPHDMYLSSEEDASSSADDFSDFEFESGSEGTESTTSGRSRREDTARVVSVIFSGKPSIVELPRRSMSPSSSEASPHHSPPPNRIRRISTDPAMHRMSICSSSSGTILHPPRTSSMLTGSRLERQKPDFLTIDPFAVRMQQQQQRMQGRDEREQPEDRPRTPKTPTTMFKRTLSLVRKRSRPTLSQYGQSAPDNLTLSIPSHPMEQVREDAEEPAHMPTGRNSLPPATYHEIVKQAQRRAMTTSPISPMSAISEPPASPMTPNGTRSRLRRQHFSMASRRHSIIRP